MLNDRSILITGGTGSLGQSFVAMALKQFPGIKRLIIFSRDEVKQYEMAQQFSVKKYPCLHYFIGDVRDAARLKRAMEGVDIVVHAAALKQIPAAEYNPMEYIKTNILGAENVVDAALDSGVQTVVSLSTDKAAAPINLYGATKLCSDKLFVAANNITGTRSLNFSVVRYGNVMGSRGSVIPYFLKKRHEGVLPITHPDMTRFNITVTEGINLIFYAIANAWGGEIFVPKIPSFKVTDLAEAIAPGSRHDIIGIRPGEKIHEEMITAADAFYTLESEHHYIITPAHAHWNLEAYRKRFHAQPVPAGFSYRSDTNDAWLGVSELRELIKLHLDPTFAPPVYTPGVQLRTAVSR